MPRELVKSLLDPGDMPFIFLCKKEIEKILKPLIYNYAVKEIFVMTSSNPSKNKETSAFWTQRVELMLLNFSVSPV